MKHKLLANTTALLLHAAAAFAQAVPAPTASPAASRPFQTAYLRIGVGATHDITGYYRSARLSAEYAPMLTRRLGLAGRLVGVLGKPTGEGLNAQAPNQNYRAAYVEEEALFYPLGIGHRVNFGVGAGGFAGYYWLNTFDFLQGTSGQLTDYKLASRQGVHAGYLFSLNLDVALDADKRWLVGLKSTLQNGIGGQTNFATHNLTFARRL